MDGKPNRSQLKRGSNLLAPSTEKPWVDLFRNGWIQDLKCYHSILSSLLLSLGSASPGLFPFSDLLFPVAARWLPQLQTHHLYTSSLDREHIYPSRSSHAHPVSHADCTGLGQMPILESDAVAGGIKLCWLVRTGPAFLPASALWTGKLGTA